MNIAATFWVAATASLVLACVYLGTRWNTEARELAAARTEVQRLLQEAAAANVELGAGAECTALFGGGGDARGELWAGGSEAARAGAAESGARGVVDCVESATGAGGADL